MKWLFSLLLAVVMVTPAFAGEDPYIAIVGRDCVATDTNWVQFPVKCPTDAFPSGSNLTNADPWYLSPKYRQFMYNENGDPFDIPLTFGTQYPPATVTANGLTMDETQFIYEGVKGSEQFRSQGYPNHPEVCYLSGIKTDASDALYTIPPWKKSAKVSAGNAGFYEWYIRLPKKPDGEINIAIQCAVVKPDAVGLYGTQAIELCAAETGERVLGGGCARQDVDPGTSPVINTALPKLTVTAYPGPFNVAFKPFLMTAFKNPSSYTVNFGGTGGAMVNDGATQVLDGSTGARIMLKACMDKTVVSKLPVTGQLNANGDTETDLEAGDLIGVRLDIPRQGTTDIYCHAQSVKIMGIGESPF